MGNYLGSYNRVLGLQDKAFKASGAPFRWPVPNFAVEPALQPPFARTRPLDTQGLQCH